MTVNRKFGYILLAVTLLLHVSGMAAERKSVTVKTPGTLNSLISGSEKYEITDLKISGRLNADDLALLRDMAGCNKEEEYTKGQLRHLDMTAATLVPGETTYIGNGKNLKITDKNSIPAYMFSNCRIERIELPQNTKRIGDMAFMQSALKKIKLPENIILENGAFRECRNLSDVTFPKFTKEIGVECFSGCSKLKKISINDIGYIAFHAFKQIENVTEITIHGVLGHADGWMCYDMPSLKTLKFEDFIISTGGPDIAENCPELKEIISLLSGEILPQRKLPRTITLRNISSEVGLIKYIFNVTSFEEDLTN